MPRKVKRPQPVIVDELAAAPRRKIQPLTPHTAKQGQLIDLLHSKQLVFAVGDAGTGKSYVATRIACELLQDREVEKIIVTRPMASAEEEIGFLPGTPDEKFAPYFAPIREIMEEHLGASYVEYLLKVGRIELAPIGFLRGHTFKNAFVIFDEAQNTTPKQMKLFLTRIGAGAKVCVDGDPEQMDIPGPSGLVDAVQRFGTLREVGVVRFGVEDNVRSGLSKKILQGYK